MRKTNCLHSKNIFIIVVLIFLKGDALIKKLLFYLDYDKYAREEAPAILSLVQLLRGKHDVDFATSEGEALSLLKQKSYDAAALSVFTSLELRSILKTAIKIKRINPAIVTILGGHGVAQNASKLINANGIDIVVEGEGEILLPIILDRLPKNENMPLINRFEINQVKLTPRQKALLEDDALELLLDGSRYLSPLGEEDAEVVTRATFQREVEKNGKKITIHVPVSNVTAKSHSGKIFEAEKLETNEIYGKIKRGWEEEHGTAFPLTIEEVSRNLHSYPNNEELNSSTDYPWDIVENKNWRSISIYAQRGCNWGQCAYCAIDVRHGRRLEVARVIALLEDAAKRGMRSVTFEDDQFLQNLRWAAQLCEEIVKRRLNERLLFGAMIRVDSVKDKEILRKLRAANFVKLQIGVESFVPEKIRYFNKTLAGKEHEYPAKAAGLIDACVEEGISPGVFIITTRPKKDRALVEVAEELLKVSEVIKKIYEKQGTIVTFSLNDMLMAYPGASLLKKERYKIMLAPLRVLEGKREKLAVETLEIPYIFEFRSMALANFVGNLRAISRRRGGAPEIMNETLEHVGDAALALRVSAEHLNSEIAVAFELLALISEQPKNFNAVLLNLKKQGAKFSGEQDARQQLEALLARGIIPPKLIIETAQQNADLSTLLHEILPRLAKERERVLAKCKEIEENIKFVQRCVAQEVNANIAYVKKELENADSKVAAKKALEIRAKTEKLLAQIYPYYGARLGLEALLQRLKKFEGQRCAR